MATYSALKVPLNHYIFFNLVILIAVQSSLSSGCIKTERESLLNFKGGLRDPGSVLCSWTGSDCCAWHGVSCDNKTGHVVRLDLHNQYDFNLDSGNYGLGGEVRPSLLGLEQLTCLDLSLNNFSLIPIPTFIGSLRKLKYLNLSSAGFGGKIPSQIKNITGLQYLDISKNYITAPDVYAGDIEWLSQFSSLKYLDLSRVDLKNATNWAQVMNTLPSLSVLHLDDCNLVSIPSFLSIANFTSLTELNLSGNNFNTTVPNWLFYIKNLVALNMSSSMVQGLFPQTIGNLQNLQMLDLSNNKIRGEIPSTIGNLTRLHDLYLSSNNIIGQIPPSIGNLQNLQELDLSSNNINGSIPSSIGNLQNLQKLDLSVNNISGSMDFLLGFFGIHSKTLKAKDNNPNGSVVALTGKLLPLKYLAVDANKLSTIPEIIGQFLGLEYLSLRYNSFKGVMMSEAHFANLTKLNHLDLSHSLLTLNVSPQWVPPFQAQEIWLGSCRSGPNFPAWLRGQMKVSALDISDNNISDTVPYWLWNLSSSIQYLDLSDNQMRGKLPHDAFEFFRSLGSINLNSNYFDGPLPRLPTGSSFFLSDNSFSGPIVVNITVSTWSELIDSLSLSNNLIDGSIPPSICKGQWEILDLSDNHLSGVLPDCWSSSALEVIILSNNNLSGAIPASMGYINLKSLHLNSNHLSGELPSSLKNSRDLVFLDLGDNELFGPIPMWLGESLSSLKVLRLRSNQFGGPIPPQLSHLAYLQVLDLANNNLSGTIPPFFGNFSSMVATQKKSGSLYNVSSSLSYTVSSSSAQYTIIVTFSEELQIFTKGEGLHYTSTLSLVTSIDLSNNGLSGDIPKELMKLTGLRFLNLSGNQLAGKIPQNIGGLGLLESLDLSLNKLSGEIPSSMSRLTFLEFLNLSYNELSGRIPSGNQLQTFTDPSIYIGNHDLCGVPLPIRCPGDGASQPISSSSWDVGDMDNGSDMIWFYMGMGPGLVAGFWGIMGVLYFKRSWRIALFRFFDDIWDWLYVAMAVRLAGWRN